LWQANRDENANAICRLHRKYLQQVIYTASYLYSKSLTPQVT